MEGGASASAKATADHRSPGQEWLAPPVPLRRAARLMRITIVGIGQPIYGSTAASRRVTIVSASISSASA
jgi:hypothetical protein